MQAVVYVLTITLHKYIFAHKKGQNQANIVQISGLSATDKLFQHLHFSKDINHLWA